MGPEPLVYRSKVNCLRVCTQGPIAVVYPEGVWYHSCTPEVLERIIQEHLVKGRSWRTTPSRRTRCADQFISWSALAASTKSLSVSPLILWVQRVSFTLPQAR